MKQKRSLDQALNAAKALRKQVAPTASAAETEPESDAHLKVVSTVKEIDPRLPNAERPSRIVAEPDSVSINPKPIWVRHTIGLHDTTSLDLRDAADWQKRKERRGQLRPGEPGNEQEIADLGIRLALRQIGYLAE